MCAVPWLVVKFVSLVGGVYAVTLRFWLDQYGQRRDARGNSLHALTEVLLTLRESIVMRSTASSFMDVIYIAARTGASVRSSPALGARRIANTYRYDGGEQRVRAFRARRRHVERRDCPADGIKRFAREVRPRSEGVSRVQRRQQRIRVQLPYGEVKSEVPETVGKQGELLEVKCACAWHQSQSDAQGWLRHALRLTRMISKTATPLKAGGAWAESGIRETETRG